MGRKRNPYLPLYTRDIMSSPRCRALSCQATGVYLWLLCRLNEPPQPGAFRLSDWEAHPNWKRSLTQQCLAEPDKQRRLQYFARYLSKNDLPWDKKDVLDGLQELYRMGIVVVEGDMLVQPRMYQDNGFSLPDLDNDGEPQNTILDDAASGSMALKGDDDFKENKGANKGTVLGTQNGTEKVHENVPVSHARASHAEIEIEYNINNIDNKGNIGVIGGDKPENGLCQNPCKKRDVEETAENNPKNKIEPVEATESSQTINSTSGKQKPARGKNKPKNEAVETSPTFEEFWNAYDKKRDRPVSMKLWSALKQEDKEAIMAYIPLYKEAQPTKRFRKDPTTFLRHRSWEDEIIREDEPRGGRAAPPPKAGDPVSATPQRPRKYKNKW